VLFQWVANQKVQESVGNASGVQNFTRKREIGYKPLLTPSYRVNKKLTVG
jgi:hypothetical protein